MSKALGIPVITIDGPTASGKGTLARLVAQQLGWSALDSGALYRLTALSCLRQGIAETDEAGVAHMAVSLNARFPDGAVYLNGQDVSAEIREEAVGAFASRIAALASLRQALLERQRAFHQAPGLVADGRDMGTVVFPDAPLKIFLVADVAARAKRRCNQLKAKGFSANLANLMQDMQARDERDRSRSLAPLAPASDAIIIDSSNLTIKETVKAVLDHWSKKGA